ncbi:MAG: PAS domain S-box protein [Methanocalculus sp. MSAO_Arc1]|uniref:hybrid sensor histidine kinase/response regulator n=1 Tax=Methanocalculus TaxID=71151 RepID=UPI000FED713A|nr:MULTISPECIES: PAS domain S-box protein [unclassified Methanocalculus]MCP1662331.1 PAS domain S-box-containing protein [Methanocalculus sp. AMF5]RQD81514.1 MAG: PAS domain S-box protein [Methanocalculus sp. MSAO_Arc1]
MTAHTLLYIDDEPGLLEIGRMFLEQNKKMIVSTCESARDAIGILQKHSFDAIISDYQMPGMNGIQFLKYLRQNGDRTPFIIFTGKGREEVVIEAFNNGADFYLQKGGDARSQFAELQNKVRHAIERKNAEEALRRSEERYRNVVETQTEYICRFKPDGTHIFVNDAYCRFYGKAEEEIIGSRFKPVIHDEDKEEVSRTFAGLTPDNPSCYNKQRIIMPNGDIVWQRWSTRAFFDTKGKVYEYQSVGRDITEQMQREDELREINTELMAAYEQLAASEEEIRQQLDEIITAQQALRESEQRYQAVIESQSEFISRFRPDGTHILVNDAYARYFGKTKEEFLGEQFEPEIHPEDQARVQAFFASLTEANPAGRIEHRIIMPDGSIRWQEWSDHAIYNKNGRIKEYQSVGRDITDRKSAEEALRLTNNKLHLLTSVTRHDILNMIMVVRGYLKLTNKSEISPVVEKNLRKMETAVLAIERQLMFTREYEQLGASDPAWIPMHTSIRKITDSRLSLSCQGPEVTLFADPMIEKVFSNLYDNTLRHGDGATSIRITTEQADTDLLITWEDDGTGIPEDTKEHIFTRGVGRNTGYGLFLAREILAITGMSITETGTPGEGARFEIVVPEGRYMIG